MIMIMLIIITGSWSMPCPDHKMHGEKCTSDTYLK